MTEQKKPSRSDVYKYDPNDLWIIGLDTTDCVGFEYLADPRALDPVSPEFIANVNYLGILEPVICVRNGRGDNSRLLVVAGRQRVKAARAANIERAKLKQPLLEVPVIQKNGLDNATITGILVSENECRRADDVLRKAERAAKMKELQGISVADIAVFFGVSKECVYGWLKLSSASPEVKEKVATGELSAQAGVALSKFTREEQKEKTSNGKTPTAKEVQKEKVASEKQDSALPNLRELKAVWKADKNGDNVSLSQGTRRVLDLIFGEIDLKNDKELFTALINIRKG